ncbi:MAG TPA: hypothetical protein VMU15_13410 [Anaeromyxobacter sp.]|nr:hypothetical protein [Anaeromyxobacter sp.]
MRRAAAGRWALLGALLLTGCAGVREALSPAPEGVPAGREGWLLYAVGQLRFEAPAEWVRSGSPRHLTLQRPDGTARLEVSTPDAPLAGEGACLADAAEVLKRGGGMERVRQHPTRLGGVRALLLEGDQNGWHVWAWAACDGGVQYQVFLTARSPAPPEVVETYRALASGARVGGQA